MVKRDIFKVYKSYMSVHIRGQLQNRWSSVLASLAIGLLTLTSLAAIFMLFHTFGAIDDYSIYDVLLCYAIVGMGFRAGEVLFRGFDTFSGAIRKGEFDRLMLRPRGIFFQIMCNEFPVDRISRSFQHIVVFVYVILKIEIVWSISKAIVVGMMVFSSAFIFGGIFVLGASLCFFTIEGLEIINILTNGGFELSKYPLTIYNKWFRYFFTFIIPFAAFNYLPLLYLLDRTQGQGVLYAFMPLLALPFFAICVLAFHKASKRYASTGS